jgi:hypothetical protein
MLFVLRTDVPFAGSAQSVITDNGTVAYTDNLTPTQYAEQRGFPIRLIDEEELGVLVAAFIDTLITNPHEETLAEYEYALNVLPPSRWKTHRGIEVFHISERLTHNIVAWHTRIGDRYFTFNDRDSVSLDHITAKTAIAAGVI